MIIYSFLDGQEEISDNIDNNTDSNQMKRKRINGEDLEKDILKEIMIFFQLGQNLI